MASDLSNESSTPSQPPREVMIEYLAGLSETLVYQDQMIPVVRGSFLMNHWFGNRARPAADIDLEWFPQPDWNNRRFSTPLSQAHTLCMFAAGEFFEESEISFQEADNLPADGLNLWEYDTPGLRYYTGWRWDRRNQTGILQIDIAIPAQYNLEMIALADIQLKRLDFPGITVGPTLVKAYTQEMLLAAKLSWIVRHTLCKPMLDGASRLSFFGEPKDVVDAYLLVTAGQLQASVFHRAMLAVALEDKLNWSQMETFLAQSPQQLHDREFVNWSTFAERHPEQSTVPPAEMLGIIIERVRELWQDYRGHVPFLQTIAAGRADESNYLVYADWLEERMDPRSALLRLYCREHFHADRRALAQIGAHLSSHPETRSSAWLAHALGDSQTAQGLLKRVGLPR